MTINERIHAFVSLGDQLRQLPEDELEELELQAAAENPWFTSDNVRSAINGIALFLDKESLESWVSQYMITDSLKVVGVVMAGNIPLVGFHDLLAVLISGNILKVKLSTKDTALMRMIITKLIAIEPRFESRIIIAQQLKELDAIIATGSDNSSRYFNYYFAKYPHIIRQNRSSCAVLTHNTSTDELQALGHDIFSYFGLGCRNVSKLFVPTGYDFTKFFQSIETYGSVIHHHKYSNNYDYNKSVYLVNKDPHLDNGFLLLKEDQGLVSPISVLFYEYYKDEQELDQLLTRHTDKIQCIVADSKQQNSSDQFGKAQFPMVDDYADGVDTMKFLTSL